MQTAESAQPLNEADGEAMDYDELTLNAGLTEYEAEVPGGEVDSKNKSRRTWTTKEEDHFYVIWGRDNWRLTQHGKNMTVFALWAEEMKERFGNDFKPQEIQARVNQTRCKFRQVLKTHSADKSEIRWKTMQKEMGNQILSMLMVMRILTTFQPESIQTWKKMMVLSPLLNMTASTKKPMKWKQLNLNV